jgi:hypothetical protein
MTGLPPRGKPVTFSDSHKLPPTQATAVRGAFSAQTLARPATSLRLLYFPIPSTLPFTKVLCFVLPNFRNIPFRPAPVLAAIHPDLF